MLPLSSGIPARRLSIVGVVIIVANFAVWLFYELPHLHSAVFHASFYPCNLCVNSADDRVALGRRPPWSRRR